MTENILDIFRSELNELLSCLRTIMMHNTVSGPNSLSRYDTKKLYITFRLILIPRLGTALVKSSLLLFAASLLTLLSQYGLPLMVCAPPISQTPHFLRLQTFFIPTRHKRNRFFGYFGVSPRSFEVEKVHLGVLTFL